MVFDISRWASIYCSDRYFCSSNRYGAKNSLTRYNADVSKKKPISFAPPRIRYRDEIHKPLNQLVIIAPLLVIFQIGSVRFGSGLLVPQYLRDVLLWFGATGRYLPAVLIVVVLLAQHVVRNDPTGVNFRAVLGMIGESVVWSFPLLAISWLTGRFQASAVAEGAGAGGDTVLRVWIEAIGAGVYEEFLFRLVFLSVMVLLFVDLLHLRKDVMTVVAILLAGVLFAACHFPVAHWFGGQSPQWGRFAFLVLAGAWWGVLFVWRGYAVAACSHVFWDFFVIAAR